MKPNAKLPYSSDPPDSIPEQPRESVDDFLRNLTAKDREILTDYLKIETNNFNVRHLMVFRQQYGEQFNILAAGVDELTQVYGCSPDAIRRILLQRLEEDDLLTEPMDVQVENGGVDAYADTIFSSTSSPISSQSPSESHTKQKFSEVAVSQITLNPQMNNQQFVEALTDEGRDMLRELLLLGNDIKDAATVKALETKHEKIGFVRLSMHVADRICSSPQAKKELAEALKSGEPETAFTVKGARHGRQMTVSPWVARTLVESDQNPVLSLTQMLNGLSEEEHEILRQDLLGNDGNMQSMRTCTARFFQKMIDNGLDSVSDLDELNKLLSENAKNQFMNGYTDEQKEMFKDWAEMDPDDPKAVKQLIEIYGLAPMKLEHDATKLARRLKCSLKELKKEFSVKLRSGYVRTDDTHPLKVIINTGIDPHNKSTVLSSRTKKKQLDHVTGRRGILARIFRKKN